MEIVEFLIFYIDILMSVNVTHLSRTGSTYPLLCIYTPPLCTPQGQRIAGAWCSLSEEVLFYVINACSEMNPTQTLGGYSSSAGT